ncbi:adenylyl-sulfate kinase [Duganella sp. LX20W]|uniref:Adenylyl-sulfate kinase n=1 Tax=Rugamonas brunnea TaxID=2758569 RepID=A0A7W2ESN5_9BURK|nr:adenylyl-sulfate kinase [Rugamonas brunnea]MBA5637876.1 adenylyl-sulfate kinase [Rugamonas brunnea]
MTKLEKLDALLRKQEPAAAPTPHIYWHAGQVTAQARMGGVGRRAATVWLTGLSGAGKSTLACALEKMLVEAGRPAYVLDGDNLRHGLNRDLGFTPEDRQENIRRSAEVARLMNDAGLIVIAAFISPLRRDRELARSIIGVDDFIETHISTPCGVCEERDPKGLYRKARAGLIPEFTGISAPYEAPEHPALTIDTGSMPLAQACELLFEHLAKRYI